MDEGEIGVSRETARVVEGGAIVELVEGDDIVVRVGEREVADEPAGAVWGGCVSGGVRLGAEGGRRKRGENKHEPRTAGDENVLTVQQWGKFGAPGEHRGVLPDARVVEVVVDGESSGDAGGGGGGALMALGERGVGGLLGAAAFVAAIGRHFA